MDEAYELFWQFKYVEAETVFQTLIDITDDICSIRSIYRYLGLCQLFQGQSANAQASWLLSIDQDTSLDELFVFLRSIATEFGHKFNRYDNSIIILEALQNIAPQDISLTSNLDLLRDLARFYRAAFRCGC
jgi:tetratricopeptide (TPR) repeat protein